MYRFCPIYKHAHKMAVITSSAVTGILPTKKIDLKNWRENQKNSGFFPKKGLAR
jgi:hypothetical protein